MDPLTQGAVGAAFAQSASRPAKVAAAALVGALAGMAPDLDALINSRTDPLLYLEYHRQFTHALVFIPFGAALCAGVLHPFVRRWLTFRQSLLCCLLGYGSHGLLDACTSYGTQLLWPFTDLRVAWNNVSVIDPLFTLPVLLLVGLAAWRRRPGLARWALVWGVGYLLLGVAQHHRALAAGAELAAARGHQPERLTAKPGFGNLLVWKIIYEQGGRYHVDAIRTGLSLRVFPGESVPRLDLERHFPWLAPDSQQLRDVARFRWFSDDFLAPDPQRPHGIIDVRYSMLPNEIDGLWGIALEPQAPPGAHVDFYTSRADVGDRGARLMAMIRGEGSVPLDGFKSPAGSD